MIRKIAVALIASSLLVLSVTACSSIEPSQGYRAPGSTAPPWKIHGELFDFTNVKIFINGEKVIDERISLLSGKGEFHSSYKGKEIRASCSISSGEESSATKCIVFVNDDRAATLSF